MSRNRLTGVYRIYPALALTHHGQKVRSEYKREVTTAQINCSGVSRIRDELICCRVVSMYVNLRYLRDAH